MYVTAYYSHQHLLYKSAVKYMYGTAHQNSFQAQETLSVTTIAFVIEYLACWKSLL